MSIIAMANNGIENIRAEMDGALYNCMAAGEDIIFDDILSEFAVTYSSSSRSVTVQPGLALIGGRLYKIDANTSVTLSASTTTYLCLRIDLSAGDGQEGKIQLHTSSANIVKGNLNNGDYIRDLLIYTLTTNSSGVSSATDNRTAYIKSKMNYYTPKVFQVDGMSTPITQSIAANTNTAVCLLASSPQINVGNNVVAVSLQSDYTKIMHYRVKEEGYYRVSGCAIPDALNSSVTSVDVYVAGPPNSSTLVVSTIHFGQTHPAMTGRLSTGEKILQLTANQNLSLAVRYQGGQGRVIGGWLTIEKVG